MSITTSASSGTAQTLLISAAMCFVGNGALDQIEKQGEEIDVVTSSGFWQEIKPAKRSTDPALLQYQAYLNHHRAPREAPMAGALKTSFSKFRALANGWDGENSVAPTEESVGASEWVAMNLGAGVPIPSAMISASGAVGLYWDERDFFLDMEFEDQAISIFARSKTAAKKEVFIEDLELATALTVVRDLVREYRV